MNEVEGDRRTRVPTALTEREATIAAIKQGIADVDAGRTVPARQAIREIANQYGLADPYTRKDS